MSPSIATGTPAATAPRATPTPFALPGLEETAAGAGDTTPLPAARTQVTLHTVQAGDTLLGLAMQYEVPMAAIQLQNDLGGTTVVQVGQDLEIPPVIGWEGASPFWVIHEVAAGETLSEIAAAHGLSLATVQAVNGLGNADLLSLGQALILPVEAPAEVLAEAHRPTALPPPPTATLAPPATATPAQAGAAAIDPGGSTVTPPPSPTPPPPTETPLPPAAPPPVADGSDMQALAVETFQRLNAERAAFGLAPLAWNETLARAAQAHANDCHQRGWCGHTGSDGSTMKERIIRAGYDPVRWSECWAWYGSPEKAVAMWMDETPPNDPHRRTILSTYLTEVGVAVVPGNGHGYYFIADFGSRR